MFRELRQTERNIAAYMDQPVSMITGMLSAWLGMGEEDTSPARIKLKQLVETCESLVFVEEILTVRENSSPFSPETFLPFFSASSSKPETTFYFLSSPSPPTIYIQKHLQVLNWDVVQAVKPPVEQIILSTDKVKIGIDDERGAQGEKSTTCCFCCDSAPPPEQKQKAGP